MVVVVWISGNALAYDQRSCSTSVSTGMANRSRVAYTILFLVFNQATKAYAAWPSLRE